MFFAPTVDVGLRIKEGAFGAQRVRAAGREFLGYRALA